MPAAKTIFRRAFDAVANFVDLSLDILDPLVRIGLVGVLAYHLFLQHGPPSPMFLAFVVYWLLMATPLHHQGGSKWD